MAPGLYQRCARRFGAGDRRRGQAYYAAGRCRIEGVTETGVHALVEGSAPEPYSVCVDWSEAGRGFVTADCECPRFEEGFPCKHLAATLLAADRAGLTAEIPGRRELSVLWIALGEPSDGSLDRLSDLDDEDLDDEDFEDEDFEEEDFEDEDFDDEDFDDDNPEDAEELDESFDALARWLQRPRSLRTRLPPPPPTRRPARRDPPAAPWRRRLAEVRRGREAQAGWRRAFRPPAEVWYRLDPNASRRDGRMVVELYQRQELKSGGLGKVKPLSVARRDLDAIPRADDRRILELLLAVTSDNRHDYEAPVQFYTHGSGYNYDGVPRLRRGAVPMPLLETVLPLLCATGRFAAGGPGGKRLARPLVWEGGEPWRVVLRLGESGDGGELELGGELRRGETVRSLQEPLLLLGSAAVFFPDSVAPLDPGGDFAWIATLRSGREIPVPRADLAAFLDELVALPDLPELELAAGLGIEEVRPEPARRLVFRSLTGRREGEPLAAEPRFDYHGRTVPGLGGPARIYDGARGRLVVRDPEAERSALAELAELGFAAAPSSGALEIAPDAFEAAVAALLERGWTVEAEGEPLRRAGGFSARVSSATDWFDLEAEMEFGGVPVQLPTLLAALRRGERLVRLDGGGRGLLPAEWIARYRPLAEIGFEETGGGLRFLPSQALLLDALLAAADFEADRRFERFRDRLRSFGGVEPADVPRGFEGELRPYQLEGLGWLGGLAEFGLGGCLADDMGLGKTIQVLALLQARRSARPPEGGRRPSIVVVPRSLLFNWLDEAARFTPRLRLLDYTGPGRAAARERFGEHDVVVTTYGTLRRDVGALREIAFDYAILDEAQAIKNPASQAAKACRLLGARHRLALTGTPVENHLGELWSLFEFLNPGMLGRLPRLRGLAGENALEGEALGTVARALGPFILRRTKRQVLAELPEKTEQTLHCTLGRGQRKLYDELRDHYRAALARRIEKVGLGRSRIQVLEALLRLRQAACHPGLIDRDRRGEGSAKLETLIEQLAEVVGEGHKALVFSQFTSFLDLVRRRLEHDGVVHEYLDGKTRKRKERVERFQTDPACPVFLISLKAGGLGLNLTAADYVFILDPWWNPAIEAQAVDRAHRIGQARPVFAYRLIARDTVEEKILGLQESKRELADALLGERESAAAALTAEDLRYLLG